MLIKFCQVLYAITYVLGLHSISGKNGPESYTFRPEQYHMLYTNPSCNLISLKRSFSSKIRDVLSWHVEAR